MWNVIKRLIVANPMGVFVYTILSKWYIMIIFTCLIVVYWVFKGLESSGLLKILENALKISFEETKAVAKYCVPKITNLNAFWDCLQNLPQYIPDEEELKLKNTIDKILPSNTGSEAHTGENPYE